MMEQWIMAFVATLLLTVSIGIFILIVWLVSEILEWLNPKNLYTIKKVICWIFWIVVYLVLMTMMIWTLL